MKNFFLVLVFLFSFITQTVHASLCSHLQSQNESTESHDHHDHYDGHDHHDGQHDDFESTVASDLHDKHSQHNKVHCRFHCCATHFIFVSQNSRFHRDILPLHFSNENDSKQIHFHSSLYRPPIV